MSRTRPYRSDSITPTFAAARLRLNNPRWEGVPVLVTAGKGLDARMTEIRIRFRDVPGNMFCKAGTCPVPNELVIRVQPDEAILLSLINKVPGMDLRLEARNLDLHYKSAFAETNPRCLRKPDSGRDSRRPQPVHPQRRIAGGLGHLHARAARHRAAEIGAASLSLRQYRPNRRRTAERDALSTRSFPRS